MKNLYQIEDLFPVAKGSEKLLLLIRNKDIDNPECLAVQVDLSSRTYYIDLIQRFLKFGNYEEIEQDTKLIEHYRYKIDYCCPIKIGSVVKVVSGA